MKEVTAKNSESRARGARRYLALSQYSRANAVRRSTPLNALYACYGLYSVRLSDRNGGSRKYYASHFEMRSIDRKSGVSE